MRQQSQHAPASRVRLAAALTVRCRRLHAAQPSLRRSPLCRDPSAPPRLRWDYVTRFGQECDMESKRYGQECAEKVFEQVRLVPLY